MLQTNTLCSYYTDATTVWNTKPSYSPESVRLINTLHKMW